jgi:TonB family protein
MPMRFRSVLVTVMLIPMATIGDGTAAQQQPQPTAPRLRAGGQAPLASSLVVGGGEVALDVTVGTNGRVTKVDVLRATPPYTDLVAGAVKGWQFDAAQAAVKGALQATAGHVLVLAVYRPPQVYAAPAAGVGTAVVGEPSPELPQPGALTMPLAYPPRATRDRTVLVEIELSAAAVPTGHRVLSPASGFDDAALETVRGWRFGFPPEPTGAAQLFAYALVGFREPVTR